MDEQCSLCGADDFDDLLTKRGARLVRCRACGLIRVRPTPAPDEIAALYAPRSGYQSHRLRAEPNRYHAWEERRARHLARIVGAPAAAGATLLDVGCATGTFLREARAQGWHVRGIEPGGHLVDFARATYGLEIETGNVEQAAARFDEASFDVITLWDVIEHVREPVPVMLALRRLLKPGGTIFLATPNEDGWVARFHWRAVRPLWGIWPHPEPPRHLFQFSRRTVRELCRRAGFDGVRIQHDEIPLWYTSGFAGEPQRGHWIGGEPDAPRARRLYFLTAPVFWAARLARRGDSMIVSATRPRVQSNS